MKAFYRIGVILIVVVGIFIIWVNSDDDQADVSHRKPVSKKSVSSALPLSVRKSFRSGSIGDSNARDNQRRKGSEGVNIGIVTRRWLEGQATPLTPAEVAAWLKSEDYSADSYLAVFCSNTCPPEGLDWSAFHHEMFARHGSDPAVVLFGLLNWSPEAGKEVPHSFSIDTLKSLDPNNALGYYIQAREFLRNHDADSAYNVLLQSANATAVDAYFGRIRSSIEAMMVHAGRDEIGASAWANFSVRESDVSSLFIDIQHMMENSASSAQSPDYVMKNAAMLADVTLGTLEMRSAGIDTMFWAGLVSAPTLERAINAYPALVSQYFGSSLESVTEGVLSIRNEAGSVERFFPVGFIEMLDSLDERSRRAFYTTARNLGPYNALIRHFPDESAVRE